MNSAWRGTLQAQMARAEGLKSIGRTASAVCGTFAFDMAVDLVKGATILAARIAEAKRQRAAPLKWSPGLAEKDPLRCVVCGDVIADVLASLGSLRCHDCRGGVPQR
ncbi:MAG TPA: hypothetical protein VE596_10805 [Gaiellaceae bacterium]|jgi:hypothetical protein|nr:hypothetical protein [Gaiellaceae bacterium]